MENFAIGFICGLMSVTVGALVFNVMDYIRTKRW